jgi:hypothetical protein
MVEATGINYIAWWGAGLSTLLAIVKLWEILKSRFRVDVGYNFTSEPEIGNNILVRNLSSNPIILEYWELHYGSYWWPFRKFEKFESPDFDTNDLQIQPHSSYKFSFTGRYYFDSSPQTLKGRKIYLKLYIAGRKPFYKKVFG